MKKPEKLKLTNEERHKRFLAEAKKAEASEKEADFDEAFKKVASPSTSPNRS